MFPLLRDFVLNFPKESVRCTPIYIICFFFVVFLFFFLNVLTLTRTPTQSSKHTCVFRTCIYRRSLARLQFCFLFFFFLFFYSRPPPPLYHTRRSRTTELAGTPSVPSLCCVCVCVCVCVCRVCMWPCINIAFERSEATYLRVKNTKLFVTSRVPLFFFFFFFNHREASLLCRV